MPSLSSAISSMRPAAMLEPQVVGSCRVSHEEGRVCEFAAVGPKHPRPMWTLIVDHDHTIADLEKDRCFYANERKEHCARVVPHVELSIARVISYRFAHCIEPLARILFRHRREAAVFAPEGVRPARSMTRT